MRYGGKGVGNLSANSFRSRFIDAVCPLIKFSGRNGNTKSISDFLNYLCYGFNGRAFIGIGVLIFRRPLAFRL